MHMGTPQCLCVWMLPPLTCSGLFRRQASFGRVGVAKAHVSPSGCCDGACGPPQPALVAGPATDDKPDASTSGRALTALIWLLLGAEG